MIYLTIPEIETIVDQKILGNLDRHKGKSERSRGYYRMLCPVCRVKLILGDKVIRTNTAKYCHVKCYSLFRFDSKEEITDEELDNFFIIKTLSCSKINF